MHPKVRFGIGNVLSYSVRLGRAWRSAIGARSRRLGSANPLESPYLSLGGWRSRDDDGMGDDDAGEPTVHGYAHLITSITDRIRQTVESAIDVPTGYITVGPALVAGYFRHARRWNRVVKIDGSLFAAIHVVQVPANGLSEKVLLRLTDELLARVIDASRAATEQPLRQWLGVVVVIEDSPYWHESTVDTSDVPATRLDRLAFLIEQVVRTQLIDAAALLILDPTTGAQRAARPSMTADTFAAALIGRAMSFRAVTNSSR